MRLGSGTVARLQRASWTIIRTVGLLYRNDLTRLQRVWWIILITVWRTVRRQVEAGRQFGNC